MSVDVTLRSIEILLGFSFLLQTLEHLKNPYQLQTVFIIRLILSVLLMIGFETTVVSFVLLMTSLILLHYYQGPYNGGADRMGMLVLTCLCLSHISKTEQWQTLILGYLSLQLVLSYFISGWVKVKNAEWRNGRALSDVFQFSAYPASESFRDWANSPFILKVASWVVILFELAFPFTLFSTLSLAAALVFAALFHVANACLFGLNRFVWAWISAYPALLWFQLNIL